MKILLAAKHISGGERPFGGVQSWVDTVASVLRHRGHHVALWEPERPLPQSRFDLGVFAHWDATFNARRLCDRRMSICHGVVASERPAANLTTLYTAEDVARHWQMSGPSLRQPIDLSFWSPAETIRDHFVFYSYRAPDSFGLPEVASAMGLPFVWLKGVSDATARDVLRGAAVVFASGRAALEAMATGAPTVICDYRPYNGPPLCCPDFDIAREHNYSGRGGISHRSLDLVKVAQKAICDPSDPRDYVRKWHDAEDIVSQLMNHAEANCLLC